MTALRNIDRHNLSRAFASLLADPADARTICDETIDESDPQEVRRFNYAGVLMAGLAALDMWQNIIREAEKQELLLPMVNAVKTRFPTNEQVSQFYDEMANGFTKRVNRIASAIRNNECVLFIGPELLLCRNGSGLDPFNKIFSLQLAAKLNNTGVYYDQQLADSLSYMANRYEAIPNATNRDLGNLALKAFGNQTIYEPIFEKLAKLQFPLVISTNPDDLLEKEYTRQQKKFSAGFYDRSNQGKTDNNFDEANTIIYKIFGAFSSPYSILFTDNDRVQFSKNVVKNDPPVPPVVKVMLENKYCLFLGFNFQEWHLKILIDCLGLTRADKEEKIFALLMENVNESSIEHFEKNYRFYFINEQVEEFVDDVIAAVQNNP